jgi:hypothetical protein
MRFAAGVLRYGQVYCHVLHMWMVKVKSHREFWKCNANLLECGKCNLEFSCVPRFVPAGRGSVSAEEAPLYGSLTTRWKVTCPQTAQLPRESAVHLR